MSRLAIFLLGFNLFACSAPPVPASEGYDRPARIVSLDYCADQYVLKLVDRSRILAVSPDASKDFSYLRDASAGLATVRPVAEDVLILKPDLVVRSYGGGPNAADFFERAGVPVLDIGWAPDIPAVIANIQRIADGMGEHERGSDLTRDMQDRLEALPKPNTAASVLYMTPAGITTGPGSLVHEIISTAGLRNFQKVSGWRSIPLERLAYEHPDIVAAAFFGTMTNHPDAWSPMKHPVARAQLKTAKVVPLEGAWTSCNGWFLMDAVEALAAGADK